jgi:hypothetical protein
MRRLLLAAAFSLMALPAMAGQCPADMSKIDAALESNTSLSAEDKSKVMELRAKGEAEHQAGEHAASVATLAEAKAILGIE